YAGRYVTADGHVLSITIGDGALTLEAPESWGLPPLTLRAENARNFSAVGVDVQMTFIFDVDGEVSGASVYGSVARDPVATTRAPLRGIVTIIDAQDDAVLAALPRRGIVTIVDVPDAATASVASAN